jgi:hypothetical protein
MAFFFNEKIATKKLRKVRTRLRSFSVEHLFLLERFAQLGFGKNSILYIVINYCIIQSWAYSFSVLSTTNFDKAGLVLYPNPTTTTFAINGAFEKVQVYAITGQLVKTFTKTIANQNFNIADLKSGVYFVKAVDASNIEKTSKLIKQ